MPTPAETPLPWIVIIAVTSRVFLVGVRFPGRSGTRKSAGIQKGGQPGTARSIKKTKPQNAACKAASAALSGLAFHAGVPRPSALHPPLCSGFAVLRSFCKTFVFLMSRAPNGGRPYGSAQNRGYRCALKNASSAGPAVSSSGPSTCTVMVSPHLMPMPISAISLAALTDLPSLMMVVVLW